MSLGRTARLMHLFALRKRSTGSGEDAGAGDVRQGHVADAPARRTRRLCDLLRRNALVRELCEFAFGHAGLDWEQHVVIDERFIRPAEVDLLIGDSTNSHTQLGWKPKVDFAGLVRMMVDADVGLVEEELRRVEATLSTVQIRPKSLFVTCHHAPEQRQR